MSLTTTAYGVRPARNDIGGGPPLRNSFGDKTDSTTGSVAFQTIRDLRELEILRETWKSWPGSRDSDLDFFSSAVRSRGAACRPHVIVLNRDGRPDAMLVGLREHKTMPVKLGRITICQPQADVLEFVHGSVRGRASDENCAALVQQVVQSLNQGEADLAVWEQLGLDSPLYPCLLRLQLFPRAVRRPCQDDHWVMNFPKGLDAFLASLGRSQRSKLRRKYQKVLDHFAGRMRVAQFRAAADLAPAISVMEQIASKSDKRRSGFGFFDTPHLREQMAVAAQEGWLRIYVLYLEDKPAAFWMGTLYERCLQADQVGYDPMWSEFSPGIFLFLNILESLRDADIDTVDFGRGRSQLKQCFASFRRVEACAHIYASTMRGLRLNLLSATFHRATILARRIYSLEGTRKLLRNRFARQQGSEPELLGPLQL